MNVMEMCAILGRAHEFFLALKRAGFSDKLYAEIINSPGNVMAKKMFASLSNDMINDSRDEKTRRNWSALLGPVVATFDVEATIEEFVVGNNFVSDNRKNAVICISFVDENFIDLFSKKVEGPIACKTVFGHKLKKQTKVDDILLEITEPEIMLGEVFQMLKRQPYNKKGSLLTDGDANVFFVRDFENTRRTIIVRQGRSGWVVRYRDDEIDLKPGTLILSHSAEIKQASKIIVKKAVKNDVGPIELIPNDDSYFLPESDGSQLIYQATDVFKLGIDKQFVELGLNKPGILRPRTVIEGRNVYSGPLAEIFYSFPGSWEDKWLTQNQVIDYCRKFSHMHGSGSGGAIFLIKKNEHILIDEENFFANLSLVNVKSSRGGLFVDYINFESGIIKKDPFSYQIITPKLFAK